VTGIDADCRIADKFNFLISLVDGITDFLEAEHWVVMALSNGCIHKPLNRTQAKPEKVVERACRDE
jgi:hypothetical protein